MVTCSPDGPGSSGHVALVTAPQSQPSSLISLVGDSVMQDDNEIVEMRSLFKEMKSLTERNAAYVEMLAKAEQARQEAGNAGDPQPIYVMEEQPLSVDQPNIENVSHEQVVITEQVSCRGECICRPT